MSFFSSKQFFNYLKNKNSFNFFSKSKIDRIRTMCFNKLDKRNYLTIKSSNSTLQAMSLLSSNLLFTTFLNRLVKMKLLDLARIFILKIVSDSNLMTELLLNGK